MNEIDKPMTVIKLQIANTMNIEALEITPDGNNVTLTGKNGAGKSAVLKAMEFALNGKALKGTPEPVRRGEKAGKVVLDFGDMIVRRNFTNETSSLKIENKEGMVFKSPQTLLDKFRGNISFDPMEFSGLPEKQQKEVLLKLIDLPIDLTELDEQRAEAFGTRTLINRGIKTLEGQRDGHPMYHDVPDEELSAVDVMAEMQKATEQNTANQNRRMELKQVQQDLLDGRNKLQRLESEISECKEHIEMDIDAVKNLSAVVESIVDSDLEQFRCKLEDVETTNKLVRGQQEQARLIEKLNIEKARSQDKTTEIAQIDTLKTKTISEVTMPIDGLGFNETGVTFNDMPLSQCSDGQRRLISASIGMALNPKLRVLWVNDASLLDSDSINDLKNMATEKGYQLWLECVSDENKVSVHIDGAEVVT